MASCLIAQPIPAGLSFEVASIRRHDQAQFSRPAEITPAQIRLVGHSLISIIMDVYGVKLDQVVGPEWLKTETYDIVAALPPGSDKSQIPAMLKSLLEERFRLRSHWEERERKVYLLRIESQGQLRRAAETAAKRILTNFVSGSIDARAVTVDELSSTLTLCCSDRFIIDQTDIVGRFDFVLDLGKEGFTSRVMPNLALDTGGAGPAEFLTMWSRQPLVKALRTFGLELKPADWPVRHLIIDAVEKVPTPN